MKKTTIEGYGVIAELLAADHTMSDFVIDVDPANIGEAEWRKRQNVLIARKVAATLAAKLAIGDPLATIVERKQRK